MTFPHDMPPDPWAEEGVDLWTLEEAERLAHDGVTGDDPRWRALEDDGPLLDDFDQRVGPHEEVHEDASLFRRRLRSIRYGMTMIAFAVLAFLVALAMLLQLR